MGDRANVAILDGHNAVVLYTHWGGSELPSLVKKALSKRWRWDDPSYLARIVFDEMTHGRHGSETGYGISANSLGDNEYNVLVIDTESQRIASREEPQDGDDNLFGAVHAPEGMTLEAFVALIDGEESAFRDNI